MTYFDDLSPYSYSAIWDEGSEVLNIGWLDGSHEYPRGHSSEGFHVALLRLCTGERVAQSRGFHQCNLAPCDQRAAWPPVSINAHGGEVLLGSAEIRVPGDERICYGAPDLIYHYVVEHEYKPPAQFVEAVQRCVMDV